MTPLTWGQIFAQILIQFIPVWIALLVLYAGSITFKRRLGPLRQVVRQAPSAWSGSGLSPSGCSPRSFSEGITIAGASVVPAIATFDPLVQIAELKNKVPGTLLPDSEELCIPSGWRQSRP